MKTFLKLSQAVLLTAMLIMMSVSCTIDPIPNDPDPIDPIDNDTQQQQPTYSLDDLQGDWIRIGGNNPVNNGLKINVKNDVGNVTNAAQSDYKVDDIKWKDIIGQGSGQYTHKELGSDYNYYPASIDYGVDDTLRVDVNSSGAGNIQKWVREANFTPQSIFLEVLQGDWIRVDGNFPQNNGMEIDVTDNTGTVTNSALSVYSIGDIKWKEIYALDANSFIHEEIGSDYKYYPATIELGDADTLRIDVNNSGAGNIQKWVRK